MALLPMYYILGKKERIIQDIFSYFQPQLPVNSHFGKIFKKNGNNCIVYQLNNFVAISSKKFQFRKVFINFANPVIVNINFLFKYY